MNNTPAPAAGYAGLKPYGQGGNGRTLLVNAQHQQMLDGLEQLGKVSSSEGYHAQAVTKAVNGLRGCASPVNSFIKDGNPNRRCIVFSGFEIEYELNSYYGGPQTDVVITDIRLTSQQKNKVKRAALWGVEINGRDRWEAVDQPNPMLRPTPKVPGDEDKPIKIGINGYADDLDHAARMLPSHICRGEQASLDKLKKTGYQLFYVPQSGSALKAGWSFIRDLGRSCSLGDEEASRILANHMKEAHDHGLYVEWTSHRGGSKVLTHAMKLLAKSQVNLDGKQKVFLSDHTSSHYSADVARRAVGMDTRDSKWYNATKGLGQLIGGQSLGAANLACSINELMHHTKREEFGGKAFTTVGAIGTLGYALHETGPKIAKLVSDFAISPAFASALLNVIGSTALAGTAAGSIPSLNEGYNTGTMDPVKNLVNKATNRLLPAKK